MVTGTVSSGDSVLAGASVSVKGSRVSTQTNDNGTFQIQAPANATLVISSVGYITKEIAVKGARMAILLESSATDLNDVVVIGYGTQRKSDVTGAVSSVKMKDIEKTPTPRIDDALQGRTAGIDVQHNDASPNAGISIRIRGINSINGGNDPLVVIDGLQGGNLNTLNPNDVQSIEVLKDASATAIYGSRGANGVVLVTTKKGREGRYQLNYDGYYSASKVRKTIPLMTPLEYATTVNENRAAFGLPTVFSDSALNGFKNGVGTDWQSKIFRPGYSMNHSLSISGGNDKTNYFVSGDALNTKGIILNTSYARYSLRSNINTKLSTKLSLGINTFLAREVNHPTPINDRDRSPTLAAFLFAPVKNIYDADGNYTLPGGGYGPPTNYNPVALAVEPVRNYFTNTTNIFSNLNYALIPGLNINISGGYKLLTNNNNDYVNAKITGQAGTQQAFIAQNTLTTFQNTNLVSYEKDLGVHHLKVTALMEQQYEQFDANTAGSIGFLTDALTYNNLGLGNSPQVPYSTETRRSLLSYMGRVNYGYKDLYLVTVTARADGSSVFGANNKWGYFPSVALGWNVINESFMRGIRTFSALKIRGSYGIVGNQAITPYQSLASLNSALPYPINGSTLETGVGLGGTANPNLKWEKTAQFNIGADMAFLQNRLDFTVDYYDKKTSDLLLAVPTPLSQGGSGTLLQNVGQVQNKGVEFMLSGRPVQSTSGLVWESGLTVSFNRNKVLALTNGSKEITLGGPGLPNFGNTLWMEVGQPLGTFRGLVYEGVWKSSEATEAASFGTIPGAPKYKDQNKDNVINDADKVDFGNAQPKYVFGFNNTFSYAGFDLNVFIQGSQGNKIYNISRVRFETTSGDADATSVKILQRWSPTNENTDVPSFEGSAKSEDLQSSRWLEDGSYIRFKNISLGYTIPGSMLGKIKIQSARLYVSGTNLITITKYSGFDPEARTGVDNLSGIDLATYPSQKLVTVGLNVNF